MCNTNRNVYDIVHMLMALPLLPRDKLMEGFVSVTDFYVQNVQHHLSMENCNAFNRYFQYYKSTWLQGLLNLINIRVMLKTFIYL